MLQDKNKFAFSIFVLFHLIYYFNQNDNLPIHIAPPQYNILFIAYPPDLFIYLSIYLSKYFFSLLTYLLYILLSVFMDKLIIFFFFFDNSYLLWILQNLDMHHNICSDFSILISRIIGRGSQ